MCLFSDAVLETCETDVGCFASYTCSSLSDLRLPICINEAMMDWFHGSAGTAEFILVDGARLNQRSHTFHTLDS